MKPRTQTLVMFAGELQCAYLFFYRRRQYLRQREENYVNEGSAMMSPADENGNTASMFPSPRCFHRLMGKVKLILRTVLTVQ